MPAPVYINDILTKDERDLLDYATSQDDFILHGYDLYGEDWENHVPDAINVAAQYLFGWQFQPYQLPMYYCPIQDRIIHGGRGSGKSTAMAIAFALLTAFWPGHNWLHVAPSLEQARVIYDTIMHYGAQANFKRIFVEHERTAPAPDIELRPWDENDPGTRFHFRSIGGHGGQPMELLRSLEAGFTTADEAFRTIETDYFITILAGIARGPNRYALNSRKDLKEQYDRMVFDAQTEPNPLVQQQKRAELTDFVQKHKLSKHTILMLTGNAGPWAWEWLRYNYGKKNPAKRWAATWTSDDNVYYTDKQKALLIQQFENDPDGLRVEMNAERPRAIGDIFVQEHLDNLFDPELDLQGANNYQMGIPGWIYQTHGEYGLVRYKKPPEKKATYAAGGDPGTGRVPNRNMWANMVARIDEGPPFEIVYVNMGNLTAQGQGSIRPWIMDAKEILATYRMPFGHFAAEATGTQKNVHEVIWPEDLIITPLSMTTCKPTLILQAQLMLGASMFVSPLVHLLEQELSGYVLLDKKIQQDLVMAFLSLVSVVWPYVADRFVTYEEDEDEESKDVAIAGREVRDSGRGYRER